MRPNFAVKQGEHGGQVEALAGKDGAFIRTFVPDDQNDPVISMDSMKLEDVRTAAKQMNGQDRGVIVTRSGLAVRTTREG